jgi:hypothetical protein
MLTGDNDVAHASNEDVKRRRMATDHGPMAVNRRTDFDVNEGEPQLGLTNSDVRFDNHSRQVGIGDAMQTGESSTFS